MVLREMVRRRANVFYFVVAAILILLQLVAASFLAHMDADDAFYVATATTSVHTDTVFPLIRIPDIPIHDYQAGMFCRRFRYFLQ